MPNRMLKRCGIRGCANTTRDRYCEEHAAFAMKLTDRRRKSAPERGYDGAWQKVAEQRRELDCELCQMCLAEDRITAANTVDHIIPLHVRPDWRLEIGNTQVLCRRCHAVKTAEDVSRYGGPARIALNAPQRALRAWARSLIRAPRDGETGGGRPFCAT